jgi:hypothetical protein
VIEDGIGNGWVVELSFQFGICNWRAMMVAEYENMLSILEDVEGHIENKKSLSIGLVHKVGEKGAGGFFRFVHIRKISLPAGMLSWIK